MKTGAFISFVSLGFLTAFVAGCQTKGQGPLTLEEAKSVATNFERPYFTPPKRQIDDLKGKFGPTRPLPADCEARREFRKKTAEIDIERAKDLGGSNLLNSMGIITYIDRILARGNYKDADGTLFHVLGALPERGQSFRKAMFYGLQVRLRAAMGDSFGADQALHEQQNYWDRLARYHDVTSDSTGFRATYFTSRSKADIAYFAGDYRTAEFHYRKAMEAARRAMGIFAFHQELGETLLKQGRLMEAEAAARTAIKRGLSSSNDYSSSTARAVSLMSAIKFEQGKIDDAEYLARVAVNMHEFDCTRPDTALFAGDRQRLARALVAKRDWPEALRQFEAIERDLANDPVALERLTGGNADWALALMETGQTAAAMERMQKTLAVSQSRYGADSMNALETRAFIGLLHFRLGNFEAALEEFRASVPKLLSGVDDGRGGVGKHARGSRMKMILEAYFQLLLRIQGSGLEKQAGIDAAAEAFVIANAERGRKVQGALAAASARANITSPELADLVRREQDAQNEILGSAETLSNLELAPPDQVDPKIKRALRERLRNLQAARLVLLDEIRDKFPQYAELINPAPASIEIAQRFMNPDEALVATITLGGKTYVWAVPKTGKTAFSEVAMSPAEIEDAVALLRLAVDPSWVETLDDIPEFDTERAYRLYAAVLEPVSPSWKPARSILFVPHGPLAQLPISMLSTEPGKRGSDGDLMFSGYRNVSWLAKSHAVTVLPSVESLSALRAPREKKDTRVAFVGFGDPYFSRAQARSAESSSETEVASLRGVRLRNRPQTRSVDSADLSLLPRLPETLDELKSIAQSLNVTAEQSIFVGRQATEARVKSMDLTPFRVVAFATHGLVPGDLDGLDQPALAMSLPALDKSKGDGLLTMDEILGLRLNADWVVLSACNTASGEGEGSDAVSGLGRAFFYAGTRALLVSHWPVHSGATRDLTTTLFRLQVEDRSMPRAEALRRTRVDLISDGAFAGPDGRKLFSYAHPLFWSAMVVESARRSTD